MNVAVILLRFMCAESNPYKSPSPADHESSKSNQFHAIPSVVTKLVVIAVSFGYLFGNAYFLVQAWNPAVGWWNAVLFVPGVGSVFTAYVLLSPCWQRLVLMPEGIEMQGLSNEFIHWVDVSAWKQKTESSQVQLVLKDGRIRYLNYIGPKRYNASIAEYVSRQFETVTSAAG